MSGTQPAAMLRGTQGAVACGHPLAAGAAIEVIAAGGGAADAAVAAAAVLAVVLPDACGLGGDAMILVRAPGAAPVAFNGSGAAPAGLRLPVPDDGGGTVGVPGAVAAWCDLHAAFGRLDLGAVLAPAVRLARGGFAVGDPLLQTVAAQRRRLLAGAPGWELLAPGLAAGTAVAQPALARTLERIGAEGPDALYAGALAEAIGRATAGHVAAADLAAHRTSVLEPIAGRYRDATLLVQPPVSQAVLAVLVLRGLDGREGDRLARTHAAVELVEAAFAHRDRVVTPDATRDLAAVELDFDPGRAGRRGGPRGYNHTTAITSADGDGTVVSMLSSLFDDFGSAVLVPEGGFMLNDRLLGFSPDPASPNAAAPGRRPVHTLSPAVLETGDRVMALATPGADGQVQTLVQLTDRIVGDGEPLGSALAAPRWRSIERHLAVEGGFDAELAAALARRGHEVVLEPPGDALFGAACVAGVDTAAGTLFAAADGRRETWAAVR
ncbi:MAG: gamma-glutamyltranspeptidase / glutathione hydrolase [Solirubrobacteraceae bacterium]|nr:gamma-glutamyltranspeptidase / glutathione hydrolase [Solirubrobacteraceae bacterium]